LELKNRDEPLKKISLNRALSIQASKYLR